MESEEFSVELRAQDEVPRLMGVYEKLQSNYSNYHVNVIDLTDSVCGAIINKR